jgi:superfamily II DNA or RNA helicase
LATTENALITLRFNNINAYVTGGDKAEIDQIVEILSYLPKGATKTYAYQRYIIIEFFRTDCEGDGGIFIEKMRELPEKELVKIAAAFNMDLRALSIEDMLVRLAFQIGREKVTGWQGKSSFYSTKWNMFPTGLISFVVEELSHIDFNLIDNTSKIFYPASHEINLLDEKKKGKLVLRDYQEGAIKAILQHERGIVRLSTRSGKTVVAIAATQALGMPTLFVVQSKDLLKQTHHEYKNKMGIEPGMMGDNVWEPRNNVTVATVQTLSRSLGSKVKQKETKEFLEGIGFVIFDEVHHASKTYQVVSRALKNARYRLGLSATALIASKENKLQSMSLTGPLIFEVKMETLVEQKHIAKPTIFFLDYRCEDVYGDEYSEVYDEGIVYNDERNMVIAITAMKQLRRGKSSLILVEKREHGEIILDLLKDKAKVKYIHGDHTSNQRGEVSIDFQAGVLDILITSRIFNEGKDIPFLESVIVASGRKSPIETYQKMGRGITKTADKDETEVFDFIDKSHRMLYNHSLQRMKLCEKNKAFTVKKLRWEEVK